jgi:hypothetical protein
VDERLEGWFTDPFGLHQARWMSQGTATRLVRDDAAESYDEPPDEHWSHDPEPILGIGRSDSLRRADDAQLEDFDSQRAIDAAQTATIWTIQP